MRIVAAVLLIIIHFPSYLCKISSPPRGWNSWISYLGCVNETQFIDNAQSVVKYLQSSGYEYVVTDGGWSSDNNGTQHIDQYGRPQPAPDKYPHGFKWLSQQIHSMGLKFGVWVGRGITATAIDANSVIYDTDNKIHAKDIYMSNERCPWDSDIYAVNQSKNGSQQFINSLYSQFAEWGVDFIKNDCIFGGNYLPGQIDMVSNAMAAVPNYEFTYSLSPGNGQSPSTFKGNVTETTSEVNMYRITGDCWDDWVGNILQHFNVTAEWAQAKYIGGVGRDGLSFPDLDMMPIGFISHPKHKECGPFKQTSLTQSQVRVLMTLWSISRSPLIFGGSVIALENDTFTRNVLTNKISLEVNGNSTNNRQVTASYDKNGKPVQVVWAADGFNADYYVAFFNVKVGNKESVYMNVSFNTIGGGLAKYNQCQSNEAWSGNNETFTNGVIAANVKANDTMLYYLHQCT